jgi:ferrochelatase
LTERQAQKLAAALTPYLDATITVAMRYWRPFTQDAVAAVEASKPDELVLLPLYPQYSLATTGSSLKEWSRLYKPTRPPVPLHVIESFYNDPRYIDAVVERIRTALSHFDAPQRTHFVFSAHGLPLSLIEKGDPYQRQVEATVGLVLECGAWPNSHTLCFQSKVGREKWLEPSLTATLERLAAAGEKNLLVIPIAFVTEHIETLHEINIEAREEAMHHGVEQFEMMPAVGDSPLFITALAELVLRATGIQTAVSAPAR